MAKRFKLKFSSVIPSLQFCRPKHSSTFPENPLPANYRLSPVNPKVIDIAFPNLPAPPPSTPRRAPRSPCHVSSSSSNVVTVDCGCRSGSCAQFLFSSIRGKPADSRPPRRKVHCEPVSSGDFGSDRSIKRYEKYGARKKEKSKKSKDWFSDDDENTTLLSSFTVNSLETICEKQSTESSGVKWPESEFSEDLGGAAVDVKGKVKVKESYAVVKKSKDPREDFKRSMMEMIVEKQMLEAEELEELLQCFLSLNSRSYHRVIVEAFSEIWELLFSDHHHPLP